jgi:hypothetical protein
VERRLIPIACTLSPLDLRGRAERWRALRPLAWELADGRLDARFAPEDAAELAELAAAERSCCGWAAWEVAGPHLVVTGDPDGIAAVAELLFA